MLIIEIITMCHETVAFWPLQVPVASKTCKRALSKKTVTLVCLGSLCLNIIIVGLLDLKWTVRFLKCHPNLKLLKNWQKCHESAIRFLLINKSEGDNTYQILFLR